MKPFKQIILLIAAVASFTAVTNAQDEGPDGPPPQDFQRPANPPRDIRNNVLRQLDLSPEQMQQIRKINMERRPLMETAQLKLRQANRSLDEAIYADQVNDADIQAKIAEVHAAQGEVARIRFQNELAVRRVLTPDQLQRFREIRMRFEQERQQFQGDRPRGGRGFRRQQHKDGEKPAGPPPDAQPPNL